MDLGIAKSAILGIVEGLTEFIPVSSTGHLILASDILRFQGDYVATFTVFIQLGAIMAVVAACGNRLKGLLSVRWGAGLSGLRGLFLLALTTLPAAVLGLILRSIIKERLFHAVNVAAGLGVGGIWILLAERFMPRPTKNGLDALTWRDALWIGVLQCLSLWPGMSRSLSTIMGGLLTGLDRRSATEYSFLAAVPVVVLACSFDLMASLPSLDRSLVPSFAVGFVVSFLAAWAAVRFLINFVSRHTLVPFGWYRVGMAIVILAHAAAS